MIIQPFAGARRGGQRESSHFRRDSQRGVSSLSCWLDACEGGKGGGGGEKGGQGGGKRGRDSKRDLVEEGMMMKRRKKR